MSETAFSGAYYIKALSFSDQEGIPFHRSYQSILTKLDMW